jgi:ADP-ribosylglycohydrolase
MSAPTHDGTPASRARLALEGLSIGDAFGQRFFASPEEIRDPIARRVLPPAPWYWTDDTAMGRSVYEALCAKAGIDADDLAERFGREYRRDPRRGYGGTAHAILTNLALGVPWQEIASEPFDGQGSMGNGGAMRSAPVGGYFADDLDAVVHHARASAQPTHAHPDGQAGAIAVAVAAALAWRRRTMAPSLDSIDFLRTIVTHTPAGATRDGIEQAIALPLETSVVTAARTLGNGSAVISSDTVPFALWCAARHLDDFEDAMWTTVAGLGDRDTTCAIVGGIVALSVGEGGIPAAFAAAREPLDSELNYLERYDGKS